MALTISGVNINGSLSAVHIPPPPPTPAYLSRWGANYSGQLGLNDTTARSSPQQVGALTTWLRISAGYYHNAAITTTGTLWSWGQGANGQLGLGNTTNISSPQQVGALTAWLSVAGGGRTLAAISN